MVATQPQDQRNIIPGRTVMFSVTASGLRRTYSWELGNGTALPTDSRFMTTNTDTLTIQDVMPSDAGSYRCVVSNAAGDDTSDAAELTLSELYTCAWTAIPLPTHFSVVISSATPSS